MNKTIKKKMRSIEVKNNEYFICFKNVIKTLKILTIFPFINFNEVSKFGQLLSKMITILSLGMYTAVNIREATYLYYSYSDVVREFNFLNIIRFVLQAVIRLLLLTFPFLTWNKSEHLKKHWDNWMDLQIEIEKLMENSYKSSARNKIQFLFLYTIVATTTVGILIFKVQLEPSSIKTDMFSVVYTFNAMAIVTIYWIMNNLYMYAISKKIIDLVRQALQENNAANLSHLIDLWIMLCDLNEEFVNCHSIIFLIMFCLILVTGVFSVFVAIVIWNYFEDKCLALTYIYGSFMCILPVLLFCESANSVIDHMVDKLKKTLLSENINLKNKKSLNMIVLFLHTIDSRKPKITFQGYIIMDRRMLTSVLGVAINYLIVLKQFSPESIRYE